MRTTIRKTPASGRLSSFVGVSFLMGVALSLSGCQSGDDASVARESAVAVRVEAPVQRSQRMLEAPAREARQTPGPRTVTSAPAQEAPRLTPGGKPPQPAAEQDAKACQVYATRVCEAAGSESSEVCQAFRLSTSLMPPAACEAGLAQIASTLKRLEALRAHCTELVDKLCQDLGPKTATCAMVRERSADIPGSQCQHMLAKYAEVLQELQAMEAANKPLAPELVARQSAAGGPAFGSVDAKVTVVEYADFECPYCSNAAKVLAQLKKKYGDTVRVVFRHYPLPFHPNAMLAAQASMAAHAQGRFWDYHDTLFAHQKALTRSDLERYAEELGLDMKRFKHALNEGTYEAAVKADMALAEAVGVQGTPSLFVGPNRVQNAGDFEALAAMIDTALATP